MSDPERVEETGCWIRFARDDLHGAKALLEREDVSPRLACFHAQQAAEKALKDLEDHGYDQKEEERGEPAEEES